MLKSAEQISARDDGCGWEIGDDADKIADAILAQGWRVV